MLNTPGQVLMPWLDEVAAVLQVWYPGEQFGTALASVLFGDEDPGGRLPVTFPAHAGQGPVQTVEQYPGIDGIATYTEDILVGYRFFAANKQQPSFPFGHGLSFARFSYEDLRVQRPGHDEIRLSFAIVNDSPRPGYEVAQLYLRCPEAAAEPPLQLKGFQRVHLRPGERRAVTFTLTSADLAAWSEAAGWTVHPGRYEVLIGASSADVRLRAFAEVTGENRFMTALTVDSKIAEALAALSLEEKVQLLTGRNFWTTWPIEKIGLRRILVSDGPSGVRGETWDERDPSLNLPSATALASSWDPDIARRYGAAAAVEARRKGVDVVLGPTINLHRSPLGGRHFEAFSEDPGAHRRSRRRLRERRAGQRRRRHAEALRGQRLRDRPLHRGRPGR